MKTPPRFGAILLLCSVLTSQANADPLASPSDTDANPYAQTDPDGVPMSVSHPKQRSSADMDAATSKALQDQAQKNNDWLLKGYEQQVQANLQAGDKNSSLYYKVMTDKNLAQMAGLPYVESTSPQQVSPLRTGALSASSGSTLSLRPDSSPANAKPTVTHAFKPLITPLGATEAAGLHNFYGSSSTSFLPPLNNATPARTAPTPRSSASDTKVSSVLDMPGETAAESDPLNKNAKLTFDMEDALPQSQSHHQSLQDLPMATNADRLRKQDATTMNVPGTIAKPPKALPLNPVIIQIPDELKPATISAPLSGHGQIADPHDFYFH